MSLFKDTLEQYNKLVYNPVGLNILHPQRVAFLFVRFFSSSPSYTSGNLDHMFRLALQLEIEYY